MTIVMKMGGEAMQVVVAMMARRRGCKAETRVATQSQLCNNGARRRLRPQDLSTTIYLAIVA